MSDFDQPQTFLNNNYNTGEHAAMNKVDTRVAKQNQFSDCWSIFAYIVTVVGYTFGLLVAMLTSSGNIGTPLFQLTSVGEYYNAISFTGDGPSIPAFLMLTWSGICVVVIGFNFSRKVHILSYQINTILGPFALSVCLGLYYFLWGGSLIAYCYETPLASAVLTGINLLMFTWVYGWMYSRSIFSDRPSEAFAAAHPNDFALINKSENDGLRVITDKYASSFIFVWVHMATVRLLWTLTIWMFMEYMIAAYISYDESNLNWSAGQEAAIAIYVGLVTLIIGIVCVIIFLDGLLGLFLAIELITLGFVHINDAVFIQWVYIACGVAFGLASIYACYCKFNAWLSNNAPAKDTKTV